MSQLLLDTTPGAGDSGKVGGDKINSNFTELFGTAGRPRPPKKAHTWQTNGVELAAPTPGNAATLLNKGAGNAGIIWAIYLVTSYGELWKDGRIQVFVDGEVLPSVEFDLATVFGTAYDGTVAPVVLANDHIHTSPAAAASKEWSGEIRFPIPYSNGIVIKLLSPTGMSTTGGFGSYFFQITGEDGLPADWANQRLKSVNVPVMNAVQYLKTDQILWMDKPNCAGSIVLLAQACKGDVATGGQQSYGFLERQQYFAVDGESTTPDGQGAINASFSSSGGEDWYHTGWYFSASLNKFAAPDVLVTAANNANRTAVMSLDFLKRHGGVRFENSIKAGWSLKDGATGNTLMNGHLDAFTILWYLDISVPFVPTPPTGLSSVVGDTTGTFNWARPKSDGSKALTGYTITLSPGGATQTVAPNVTTALFTGLTNGVTYTASLVATSGQGSSTAATATVIPASVAPTAPGVPTIGLASAGVASASVAFTPPASNGGSPITGYTVTSSPGGFTATGASSPINVPGLTNGTPYTFTVHATNAVGNSAESAASNSATPVASATAPGAPTSVVATGGNAQASIAFAAPASNGGAAITGYTVTSTPGGLTVSGASSPLVLTGLTNGTPYTFTVHATNSVGDSAESTASNSVTPAAGATTVGEDTFVRANGNVVGSVVPLGTPGGQSWVQGGGSFSPLITSNAAMCNTSEANLTTQSAVFQTGLSDLTVFVTGAVPSGVTYSWGPTARWTGTTTNIGVTASSGSLKLYVNNVNRGSAFSITPGTGPNVIKLDVRGLAVNVYWNGTLAISYTLTGPENTALTGQKAGFAFFKGASPNETGITQITDVKVTN